MYKRLIWVYKRQHIDDKQHKNQAYIYDCRLYRKTYNPYINASKTTVSYTP